MSDIAANIIVTPVSEFMDTDMLTFAAYTVKEQAIPSVHDGLKPVHRRILYQMNRMSLSPDHRPVKSAKIAAATSGDLHPHGDQSIYETMTRLTRLGGRVPFIEGIGNFGHATGDRPAAARYTEARLRPAGWELVREIADGAAVMKPNYDDEIDEPVHLPSTYPALLLTGASGTAYGWATLIPSHNPLEIIDATLACVDNPDITDAELMDIVPGPDFGEGCTVIGGREGFASYVSTGKGTVTVAATLDIEDGNVVIRELPPQVSADKMKDTLTERARGGLISVRNVYNHSDLRHPVRLVIEPKRGTSPEALITELRGKIADLEYKFHANMVALDEHDTPRVWTLKEMIQAFIEHRDRAVARRSQGIAEKLESKLPQARAIATVSLDKTTTASIMVNSESRDAAITALMAHFDLTDEQARMVTGLALYRLTRADALSAGKEVQRLEAELARARELATSAHARKPVISQELTQVREVFADASRRTRLDYDQPVTTLAPTEEAGLSRWKFDEGILSDKGETLADDSVLWAAFSTGRVKRFAGAGLPKTISPQPMAPNISELVGCGVLGSDEEILLVTRAGNAVRINPETVSVQGKAGRGVAGARLLDDFDGDTVVGAWAVKGDEILATFSETGYKLTAVSDIPVRGSSSAVKGVIVHKLISKDTGVSQAWVAGAVTVDGAPASATPRSRATVKEPTAVVSPVES